MKFNFKKIILASSAFKIENYKRYAYYTNKKENSRYRSRTRNLVSGLGYMPPLPLIYYEDAPGFLLNYDTETLYNHVPCPSTSYSYTNINNFTTLTLKTYKLVSFNMTKGDSYFELNNVLNPLLAPGNVSNKTTKYVNKNISVRTAYTNYGYHASTKHVNPLEDLNRFSFKKVLLKHDLSYI